MAGYAIVLGHSDGNPAALASLAARFSSPVYPGETLLVETYREGADIRFNARVKERDVLVLTQGRATLRTEEI